MKGDKRVELSLRYGAAFVAAIFTAAGMGCIVGWSSPALEYLNSSESNLQITKNEKSWITPLLPVGQIFGYLLLPFVHKLANEKWTLLLSSIPQLLSWFLIIIAKNSYYIFLARLLGGIGYACGLCSLTIYLTEISTKSKRGIFLAFIQLFVSVGFIFMILFDLYFHYYYMNIIIISTLSCFVFVFFFMPDSSYFKRNEADYDDEERGEEMVVLNGPENWKMENDYFKYSLTNLKRIKDTEDIESAEDIEIKMKLLERVVFEGRVDCELEAIKRNEEEEGDNFLGKEEIGNVKEEIKNSQKRSEEDNGLKKITKTKEAMKKIEDIKIRKEDKTGKVKRKNEVKIEGIIKRDKKDVKIKKEAIKEFTNEEIEKEATKKAKKEAVKEAVKEATKEEVKKEAIKKGIKEEIKEDIKREAKKKEIEKDGKKEEMKQEAKNEEIKKEAKRNEMKKEEAKIKKPIEEKDEEEETTINKKSNQKKKPKKNSIIRKIKNSYFWQLITIETYRNAMLIVICVAAQEHFAGASVIKLFTQQIFKNTKSSMSIEEESLLLGFVKLIASLISIYLIEKFPRKGILLYTGLLGTFGLTLAGTVFFLESLKIDTSSYSWLPIFGILFFDFNFTIGVSNFLFIYLGELFIGEIKTVAITVCKVICLIFIFINILLYQELSKYFGIHVIFGIYAINSIVLLSIIMKITPETKGRSLQEIQNSLKNKKIF